MLAWLGVHLAGVLKESLRTRENLPWSMVTGRKRFEPGASDVPSRWPVAVVGMGVLALAGAAPAQRLVHVNDPEAPIPWSAPALARDEAWTAACGDCHLAYHPSLLTARSWNRMLDEQHRHFGEDLYLDDATVARLRTFATRNAAEAGATETAVRSMRATPPDQAPQRITETSWWARAHNDLPPTIFHADPVRTASRCEACHRDAADGTFLDGAMTVPTPTLLTEAT